MSKNILLISETILKERTKLHSNVDPKLLFPDIKVAQDMYIEPLLGTALYNKILDEIDAGTLTGAYKTLVDDFIIDALIYYTLSELPMSLSLQYFNRGIVRKTGDNTEGASMSDLIDIANKDRRTAEYYGNKLRLYLKQTATSTVLSEYLSPGDGYDTVNPHSSAFTVPVYLGNADDDYCLYKP